MNVSFTKTLFINFKQATQQLESKNRFAKELIVFIEKLQKS